MDTEMVRHGERAVRRCEHLAGPAFSESAGELYRYWLGPAYRRACDQVRLWMEEAGMTVRVDAAGSLVGRYEGRVAGAPALVIGSHLDTVRNGGAYDGILGVMLGIEAVAALSARDMRLDFAVEVVGFGDEEGSRFPAPMFCSRSMAGLVDTVPDDMVDADGMSVTQAMRAYGLDPARLGDAARRRGEVLAFIEAHIEQGPCLEATDRPLGVVTAIAAQKRQRVRLRGQADHAGTTPMALRRDALAGAAEIIGAVERIGREAGANHVASVGYLDVHPNVSNVIADEVRFSLDIRAETDAQRDRMVHDVMIALHEIVARRGLEVTFEPMSVLAAAACDTMLAARMAEAVAAVTHAPAPQVLSGAGHDAMAMVHLCPMAMLFLRSPGGLSHHPDEAVHIGDVELAHRALLHFVEEFSLS